MSTLLTVENLTKTFGPRLVLSDISFTVRAGEVLGLIGPNGAGKTTVLECLAGLVPMTSGQLLGGDKALALGHRKELLFYMPDGILPWAEHRVHWVLQFFEKLYRRAPEHMSSLTDALRLREIKRSRIATLSKGERKRLLLALGLLASQPLLLLDEPFDGLDLRQTREVMTLLRKESASGRALLVSIHQLNDAAKVCDRLVLLNSGKRVAEGTLGELQTQANLPDGGLEEIFLALT
ncbi:MAG TPA: ABC transporter ATP-binding protein [Pyrinomonadaceae bacterium]|nr:ABC transporter ATP-binding protein [Pyrinomonadaceae bacterium]